MQKKIQEYEGVNIDTFNNIEFSDCDFVDISSETSASCEKYLLSV